MKQRRSPRNFLIAAFFCLWGTICGQVTSTIQGRITDPSGAVIAGSTIRVTNERLESSALPSHHPTVTTVFQAC